MSTCCVPGLYLEPSRLEQRYRSGVHGREFLPWLAEEHLISATTCDIGRRWTDRRPAGGPLLVPVWTLRSAGRNRGTRRRLPDDRHQPHSGEFQKQRRFALDRAAMLRNVPLSAFREAARHILANSLYDRVRAALRYRASPLRPMESLTIERDLIGCYSVSPAASALPTAGHEIQGYTGAEVGNAVVHCQGARALSKVGGCLR
jgi:hypothetical protein